MNKTTRMIIEWIIILVVVFFLSMAWLSISHAETLAKSADITLEDLASNPELYDGATVELKGKIKNITELIGRYEGQYVGITLDHGITAYIYQSEIYSPLVIGETIFVMGVFHKYMLYAGSGHDLFIAVKHLNSFK